MQRKRNLDSVRKKNSKKANTYRPTDSTKTELPSVVKKKDEVSNKGKEDATEQTPDKQAKTQHLQFAVPPENWDEWNTGIFPSEVWLQILESADKETILSCLLTSWKLNRLASLNRFWKPLYSSRWTIGPRSDTRSPFLQGPLFMSNERAWRNRSDQDDIISIDILFKQRFIHRKYCERNKLSKEQLMKSPSWNPQLAKHLDNVTVCMCNPFCSESTFTLIGPSCIPVTLITTYGTEMEPDGTEGHLESDLFRVYAFSVAAKDWVKISCIKNNNLLGMQLEQREMKMAKVNHLLMGMPGEPSDSFDSSPVAELALLCSGFDRNKAPKLQSTPDDDSD